MAVEEEEEKTTLVVLVTDSSPNRQQVANQERTKILLKGHNIEPVELVDGIKQKELRNKLFGISGVRGNYPQFFIKSLKKAKDDEYTFLGLFDDIESMNEIGSLTNEALGLTTTTTTSNTTPPSDESSESADWIPLIVDENTTTTTAKTKTRGGIETDDDDEPMMVCWGCQLPSWFPKISMKSPLVTEDSSTTITTK